MDTGLSIRMLLAVGMLAGLAWLAHALKRKRLGGIARGPGLTVRDRVALNSQHTLHLVTLPDGRWVVVASSPRGCHTVAARAARSGLGRGSRQAPRAKARGATAG